MAIPFSIDDHLRDVSARVDGQLRRVSDACLRAGPPRLAEAIGYALLGGGKRLRPALALAAAEAVGGDASDASLAMRFAISLEMIHTYSLVHDDLPCMDDDDLRRGRPTVHRAYDEATAVLVGDGLQSLAFAHLLDRPDARSATLARLLARGATRMVEGQAIDMAAQHVALGEPEVLDLMARKTGALLAAAVSGGAIAGGGDAECFDVLGAKLGVAFQIADDLLDLTSDSATLGKRVGKDAEAGKATIPGLVGLAEARRRADTLCDDALALLVPFGERAEPLRQLARFVVSRRR
ncbi:MAG TPA: polyprenyl synthetase family protein [Anaeromyxobacteraceae bacterium]|nr:polyprenyl synthetase family protein [Anaeromyxobacteraceae bacterium]